MATAKKTTAGHGRDAPSTLSPAARTWWHRLVVEFDLTDAAAQLLLTQALVHWDRAHAADARIAKDGLMLSSGKAMKAHPLIAISRDSNAAFQRALKALNLDIVPLHSAPGRPPTLPTPLRKVGD